MNTQRPSQTHAMALQDMQSVEACSKRFNQWPRVACRASCVGNAAGQAAAAAPAAGDDDDDFVPSTPVAPPLLDHLTEELLYTLITRKALVCHHTSVRTPLLHLTRFT